MQSSFPFGLAGHSRHCLLNCRLIHRHALLTPGQGGAESGVTRPGGGGGHISQFSPILPLAILAIGVPTEGESTKFAYICPYITISITIHHIAISIVSNLHSHISLYGGVKGVSKNIYSINILRLFWTGPAE